MNLFPLLFAAEASSQRARAALSLGQRRQAVRDAAQAKADVTRVDFTQRLGLPSTATNAEVLSAVDAVVAQRDAARLKAARSGADDALYELAFGADEGRSGPAARPAAAVAPLAEDALYALAFGGDE